MKKFNLSSKHLVAKSSLVALSVGVASFGAGGLALAATSADDSANTPSSSSSSTSTTDTSRLNNIKNKGSEEITRRLNSLNGAANKISNLSKLTASDKSYLSSEVSTEISGLTALKTKLAGDTTLADAQADAQSIFTDYRVYALILPKIWLVKTADDQQVTETNLTMFASKLQTRITEDQSAGKDVANLQTDLTEMNTQISAAQAISSSIEQKVLPLQPSDYDTDHTILSGDASQLKTAQSDNQSAYNEAKTIVAGLKSLS